MNAPMANGPFLSPFVLPERVSVVFVGASTSRLGYPGFSNCIFPFLPFSLPLSGKESLLSFAYP